MKKYLLVCFLIFTFFNNYGQETDTTFHRREKIGFGIANIGEIVQVITNGTNPFPKTTRYFGEIHYEIDTNIYVRFGVSSAISSDKNGNLRNFYFEPLNFNIGLEKLIPYNKFEFIYGADLFYTMSLRGGNQFGSGMWRGDDFGFGIAPIGGIDYTINKDWIIGIEIEIGIGLFRDFANAGNITKQVLRPGIMYPRTLSISLKYKLWNS